MWVSNYKSPYNRLHPELPTTGMHSDEALSTLIFGMVMGTHGDWRIIEARDGYILLQQWPPHHAWEWEFTRQDA